MELRYNNVNDAFTGLVADISRGRIKTVEEPSRNGPVIRIPEPVLIRYEYPRQRVLFNPARDANPFFHLYESLWMLAGRNDVRSLVYYNKRMAEFSDDGSRLNGAYGYRWRHAETISYRRTVNGDFYHPSLRAGVSYVDQLALLIDHLKAHPESRRAVLQMWNVEDDLLKVNTSKDTCCNLSVMISLREEPNKYLGTNPRPTLNDPTKYLDMTVTNRSNDLIWGLLGANYVHFSILQEYMACALGVSMGRYYHLTNNLHAYKWNWKPKEWFPPESYHEFRERRDRYGDHMKPGLSLVQNRERFDKEVADFVERHSRDAMAGEYGEPFLDGVAQQMCIAWHHYKNKDYNAAITVAQTVANDDWSLAAVEWLKRRKEKHVN